jgi:protocatechuate 3,4-dioxygenase, beta subunit
MMLRRRTMVTILIGLPILGACQRTATAKAGPGPSVKRPLADLYQCEGCEGAAERDPAAMESQSQISNVNESGEPFVFEGVVYQADGKTPAPNVVLYAYHTNADGRYANGSSESVWSRRHGRLRGWVRTGADGRYLFRSIKPAPYPNDVLPAHVHITVLEPERRPYWIDDIVFEGEFGVTKKYRESMIDKGGNGIVKARRSKDGTWWVTRDIILEPHPA